MNKTKWHSKLVSLAVALALVASLVGIAVAPLAAGNGGTTLTVTVSTPADTYCCCDTFNVTATIDNTGASNATGVNATLTITGNAEIGLGTGVKTNTKSCANITPAEDGVVVWEVHCTGDDGASPTKFTVTAVAANAPQASGYTTVVQKSGDLQAFIIEPLSTDEIPFCNCFNLTFYVKNTGCNNVTSIFALVWTVSDAEIVSECGGVGVKQITTEFLLPEEIGPGAVTENYTVMLHCTGTGRAGVHVTPYGNDVCDKITPEIVGESAIVEWDQVFGLSCNVTPNPTKVGHNTTFTAIVGDGAQYDVDWEWDFDGNGSIDDSDTSSISTIVTEWYYDDPGNYTACVNVTDASDTTVQCCKDVRVYPALNVTCEVEPLETKLPHCLNFTAEQVGGLPEGEVTYTWHWDITDEDTSAIVDTAATQDYEFCPASAGNYSGTVTLTDDLEPANTANCTTQIARVHPALNVTCAAEPEIIKLPHCVNFTAEASGGVPGNPLSWSWNITDDDDGGTSVYNEDAQNVTWYPSSAGNYTGIVTVTDDELGNSANCTTEIVRVYGGVNVTCDVEPEVPVCHEANFSANVTGGMPEASYNWTWVFKNEDTSEEVGTSDEQNPSFTFMCVGNYTGFVTACDNLTPPNCANCTANVTVTIFPPELYQPGNGVTLPSGEEVCFEWDDIGCCNYTLQVWQKEADGQKVWLVETGHDNTWCGPLMDGNYRWWVIAMDMCGNNATSEVQYFGVQESNIDVHVTRPDGGEEFAGGETETITWDAAYVDRYSSSFGGSQLDLSIAISYSLDSGGTWTNIATGEENDGNYAWSVPLVNSDQCLVKVVATDDFTNLGVDTSDSVFTITTGVIVSIPDAAVSDTSSVIVPININGVTDLASVDIWLTYNKDVVTVANVTAGTLGAITVNIDNTNGVTKINRLSATGNTGDFIFANVELQAVGIAGETSALDLDVKEMVDPDGVDIPHGVEDGVFTIMALMEGDVTLNSHVTIADAMFVAQHLVGYRTLNADQLKCADTFVDDGTVDILDAVYIAQWLVDPTTPLWDATKDADMLPPVP